MVIPKICALVGFRGETFPTKPTIWPTFARGKPLGGPRRAGNFRPFRHRFQNRNLFRKLGGFTPKYCIPGGRGAPTEARQSVPGFGPPWNRFQGGGDPPPSPSCVTAPDPKVFILGKRAKIIFACGEIQDRSSKLFLVPPKTGVWTPQDDHASLACKQACKWVLMSEMGKFHDLRFVRVEYLGTYMGYVGIRVPAQG